MLFAPLGCDLMSASQVKGGALVVYDTSTLGSGPVARFQLSGKYRRKCVYRQSRLLTGHGPALCRGGDGARAARSSRPDSSRSRRAVAQSMNIVWHAQFGPDSLTYAKARSAPTVTAGGVVLLGTPCAPTSDGTGCLATPSGKIGGALWAIDASSGAVLGGGKPILFMPSPIRMAPVVDGNWVFVLDAGGHLAGLTLPSG